MYIQKFIDIQKTVPVITFRVLKNENIIVIAPENNIFTLTFFKKHINYQCTLLSCISGVDYFDGAYRFSVVYDVLSLCFNFRLRFKAFINEIQSINSVISVFVSANWWEREIWDFFGVYFKKHSDLRRILTDYGFEGYPMRKDFPLSGYIEIHYSENKKRIVLDRVQLTQDFRHFIFDTSW